MGENNTKTIPPKSKPAVSIPVSKLTLRKKREKGGNSLKWLTFALITAGVVPAFLGESSSFSGTLSITFISIILEALPFILLGTLVGGIIEEFVSRDMIASIVPKNRYLAAFIAAGAGVIFPVCECAIIPVTRRVVLKGVPFSAAVAYLIAGPIVNPVTFASTGMAYLWNWKIAVIRLLCGYGIGVLLSLIMGKFYPGKSALNDKFLENNEHQPLCSCQNCGHHDHHHEKQPFFKRAIRAVNHAIDDFLGVGQYLIIGAFAASLAHTLISADTFVKLSNSPEISIVLMMGLAGVLNLCSEADAFVAASFRYILPLASQMAFMVFGAMWDLKLAALYMSFVKKRAFIVLTVLIILSVFITMIILHHSIAIRV